MQRAEAILDISPEMLADEVRALPNVDFLSEDEFFVKFSFQMLVGAAVA